MIDSKIFEIAQTHADAIQDATGKVIVPAGRTAMSNLVALSAVSPTTVVGSQMEYADLLEASTRDSADAPSMHTTAIGEHIDSLIPLVSSHISFIQNTVRPKVTEFEQKLGELAASLSRENPMGLFEVVQVSSPAPLEDQGLLDLVERFADANILNPGNLGSLPAASVEELAKIMTVSSTQVDNQVKAWLAERGDAWLLSIWQTYFASANMAEVEGGMKLIRNFTAISSMNPFQRLEVGLTVFLLARGLVDEPMDGAGMDLGTWRASMDAISRYAAQQVKSALSLLERVKSNQVLIVSFDERAKRVVVHSPVYMQYLQEGGAIEDVLGAALSGSLPSYNLAVMREKGAEFKDIWNNYANVGRATLDMRAVTQLANEAKSLFLTTLMASNEDEQALLDEQRNSFENMRARADEIIDSCTLKQLQDVRELSLKLIAGVRFKHTPAESFLRDMLDAEAGGCKNAQEAAFIAALNYVSAYCASLLGLGNPA